MNHLMKKIFLILIGSMLAAMHMHGQTAAKHNTEVQLEVNLRIDFGIGKQTAGFCFGFSEAF